MSTFVVLVETFCTLNENDSMPFTCPSLLLFCVVKKLTYLCDTRFTKIVQFVSEKKKRSFSSFLLQITS